MNAEQTKELKPCPFCNQAATRSEWRDESTFSHNIVSWHSVGCFACEIDIKSESITEAEIKWNTRTPDPRLDVLRKALEDISHYLDTPKGLSAAYDMREIAKKSLESCKEVL